MHHMISKLAQRYDNTVDTFLMGWRAANPRCLARIFRMPADEERTFYRAVSSEPLRPDMPLSTYRKRVVALAKNASWREPAAKGPYFHGVCQNSNYLPLTLRNFS